MMSSPNLTFNKKMKSNKCLFHYQISALTNTSLPLNRLLCLIQSSKCQLHNPKIIIIYHIFLIRSSFQVKIQRLFHIKIPIKQIMRTYQPSTDRLKAIFQRKCQTNLSLSLKERVHPNKGHNIFLSISHKKIMPIIKSS